MTRIIPKAANFGHRATNPLQQALFYFGRTAKLKWKLLAQYEQKYIGKGNNMPTAVTFQEIAKINSEIETNT